MFGIRRRSTGQVVESGFKNREEGKPLRNDLNSKHYGKKPVPVMVREFYIVRTVNHPLGSSQ